MDFTITVTLSDRFFDLLEEKLPDLGRRVERAVKKELVAQASEGMDVSIELNKQSK